MLAAVTVPHLICNPVKLIPVNITINARLIKQLLSIQMQAVSVTVQRFRVFSFQSFNPGIFIAVFPETTQTD
jgi:hypothetical protein